MMKALDGSSQFATARATGKMLSWGSPTAGLGDVIDVSGSWPAAIFP
jgi:hypothetical protein